jgi:microcystin-dependent protein
LSSEELGMKRALYLAISGLVVSAIVWATTVPNIFSSGDTLSAAKMNENFRTLQQAIDSLVPPGTIIAYGGPKESVPAGWLLCDGKPIIRTAYASLFGAIGTAWGKGDGTNTFNVPDLRGRFLRGTDNGAKNDPDAANRTDNGNEGNTGDAVGSLQADQLKKHTHVLLSQPIVNASGSAGAQPVVTAGAFPGDPNGGQMTETGGNETRPVNLCVNYLIKY